MGNSNFFRCAANMQVLLDELFNFIDSDRVEIFIYGNDGFDGQEKLAGKEHIKKRILNTLQENLPDCVPNRHGQDKYEYTLLEYILIVVAKKWGNEHGGGHRGNVGLKAIDILERNGIDWKNIEE